MPSIARARVASIARADGGLDCRRLARPASHSNSSAIGSRDQFGPSGGRRHGDRGSHRTQWAGRQCIDGRAIPIAVRSFHGERRPRCPASRCRDRMLRGSSLLPAVRVATPPASDVSGADTVAVRPRAERMLRRTSGLAVVTCRPGPQRCTVHRAPCSGPRRFRCSVVPRGTPRSLARPCSVSCHPRRPSSRSTWNHDSGGSDAVRYPLVAGDFSPGTREPIL